MTPTEPPAEAEAASHTASPKARRRPLRLAPWLRCAWAAPNSALGLLLAAPAWAAGARVQRHAGVLEVHGGALLPRLLRGFGGAQAVTFGHVVLARHALAMQALRGHERVHVRQCETWGPLFLPAYLGASAWAWLRGRRPYLDNPFEREAFALAHTRVALARDRAQASAPASAQAGAQAEARDRDDA